MDIANTGPSGYTWMENYPEPATNTLMIHQAKAIHEMGTPIPISGDASLKSYTVMRVVRPLMPVKLTSVARGVA